MQDDTECEDYSSGNTDYDKIIEHKKEIFYQEWNEYLEGWGL